MRVRKSTRAQRAVSAPGPTRASRASTRARGNESARHGHKGRKNKVVESRNPGSTLQHKRHYSCLERARVSARVAAEKELHEKGAVVHNCRVHGRKASGCCLTVDKENGRRRGRHVVRVSVKWWPRSKDFSECSITGGTIVHTSCVDLVDKERKGREDEDTDGVIALYRPQGAKKRNEAMAPVFEKALKTFGPRCNTADGKRWKGGNLTLGFGWR